MHYYEQGGYHKCACAIHLKLLSFFCSNLGELITLNIGSGVDPLQVGLPQIVNVYILFIFIGRGEIL